MIELIKSLFYFILFVIALAGNNHPEPPAIPIVQAIYDHEKITIYWDRASEKSIDPLSKYSDFEGYRVFRSTDGGETWGAHWDKIYDYSTPPNQVGWEPWRQYDLRGLRDSSHCIYSDAFYESNPDGEKCYSNSIDIGQIEPDSLIIILNKQKQYLKIDTIFQEINSNGSSLRSSHFIEYIGDFNKTLTQKYSLVVDTIIVDTVYELINTNDISLDSLGQLLKLDGLIFEPDNKPCSDNASNNHHDCLCESSALWTGNGCVKWNGSEYIVASTTGSTWDRTSFYIPILSGDIINKSIKSNSTDSLDRVKVSVPGIEIDTIFYSIVTGDISADSINKLIDIGGVLIDTVLHPIIVGNIDADSIDVLIGMGEDSLKSDYGGYIDTVFHNISTIGCKYGKLCEFDSTCNTENETNGISWVCDTTATYVNGGELGTTTAEATDSLRILNNNSTTSGTGWREYCDGSGCGSGIVDTTYIKKCDWYVLPNSSQSTIYYPDWKVLPNISTSVISVPDWEVINNCTSIINVPDFTVKSSGCYAYGADCAIQPSCWAYGISSSECNDPGSTSNIKIKVPHWKIKSSGVSIPVPDWWVSENSNSKIQIPNYNRNEDVSGYHELALWTNIGSDESSNKGLFRSFTDNHVLDGIEYTYAVTAYDMGLKTYNVSYIDELSEPFYDKNNDGERGKFEYYIDIDESANCNDIIDGIFISDTIWSNANPDHIRGINERGYPSFSTSIYHESFTDYNANGTRDIGEDFIDCGSDEDGNAICENDEGWKETFGNGEWGLRENPTNVISIVPGYKASNRKFTEDSELVVAEATNIGNGNTLSRIVNINDIDTARIIRFEVNAKLDSNAYGNSLGSFATQVPSMYAWEITDEDNTPINTYSITTDDIKGNLIGYTDTDIKSCNKGWRCSCIDDWELGIKTKIYSDGSYIDYNCRKNLSENCDSDCENECIEDCMSVIQDLPGVVYEETSEQFVVPDYVIDNFTLSSIDNPNYESYWTDWLYGVQFRFDNGPDKMPQTINIKNITFRDSEGNIDTTLHNIIKIDMAYQSVTPFDFSRRPGFIYKMEFGTVSNVGETAPVSSCEYNNFPLSDDGSQINTFLPFKITNTTLNSEVSISHLDKGSEAGEIEFGLAPVGGCEGSCLQIYGDICYWFNCIPATGYKDCIWQSNEVIKLIDTVYTSSGYGEDGLTGINVDGVTDNSVDDSDFFPAKLFQFRIEIDKLAYAEYYGLNIFNIEVFDVDQVYGIGDMVYDEGWMWEATNAILLDYQPGDWIDDGNGININPWKIMYPWEDGFEILVEPYGWFADGDAWTVNLANLEEVDDKPQDDLDDISVVPNPYIAFSDFDQTGGNSQLRFTRLPLKCTIVIYTVNGELVKRIYHESTFDGNEVWDLKNEGGIDVAPGLYIYVIEADNAKKIDKFAIIR